MKFDNLRAFEKHLQASASLHLSPLYTLLSKDSFDLKRGVDALLGVLPLPIKSYESAKIDAALGDLSSFSLFSEKRIIQIREIEALTKPQLATLSQALKNLPRDVCLILSGSALHRGSTLYKSLEELGIILDIPELKPWEKEKALEEWVAEYFSAAKKKISPQMAKLLVKQTGLDQSQLQQEMEKLICYTGGKNAIEMQDIAAIASAVNQETIWQLGEALFARQAPAALRITRALLDDGLPVLTLLRQIRSQFQTDYQVCCLLEKGLKQEVPAQFPYMKGFILERHIQQAGQYGLQRFKRGLLKIDAAEIAVKSSPVAPELLTDILIAELCQ